MNLTFAHGAIVGVTLFAAGTASATFDHKFCNDNDYTVGYSVVSGEPNGYGWVTDGWYELEAGQCSDTWSFDSSPVFVRGEGWTSEWGGDYLFCVEGEGSEFLYTGAAGDGCATATQYKIGFAKVEGTWGAVTETRFHGGNYGNSAQTLDVCNRTDQATSVAVGFQRGPFATRTYDGWHSIEAGQCQSLDFPNVAEDLEVVALRDDGRMIWQAGETAHQHCISTSDNFWFQNPDESRACNLAGELRASFITIPIIEGRGAFDITADAGQVLDLHDGIGGQEQGQQQQGQEQGQQQQGQEQGQQQQGQEQGQQQQGQEQGQQQQGQEQGQQQQGQEQGQQQQGQEQGQQQQQGQEQGQQQQGQEQGFRRR